MSFCRSAKTFYRENDTCQKRLGEQSGSFVYIRTSAPLRPYGGKGGLEKGRSREEKKLMNWISTDGLCCEACASTFSVLLNQTRTARGRCGKQTARLGQVDISTLISDPSRQTCGALSVNLCNFGWS